MEHERTETAGGFMVVASVATIIVALLLAATAGCVGLPHRVTVNVTVER